MYKSSYLMNSYEGEMSSNFRKDFVAKYEEVGPERFYRFLLSSAILKLAIQMESKEKVEKYPDLELMDYYDKFLILYRREGEDNLLEIAQLCRRAAHKIHRELLRQKIIEKNILFLNIVK